MVYENEEWESEEEKYLKIVKISTKNFVLPSPGSKLGLANFENDFTLITRFP